MNDVFGKALLTIPFGNILSYIEERIELVSAELRDSQLNPMKELVLLPLLTTVKEHPKHAGLVYATDLFRQAFHDLIMPMEPWLFIKMPDFNDELSEHAIDREEAFATLPGYFDSCRVLGTEDFFPVHDYYRSPWNSAIELDDVKKIMVHCRSEEGKEGAIQLDLLDQRNRVVSLWDQAQEYVQRESMQEVLDAIWKTYSIAGMLAFQVNQSIFTDFSYSQKPRYVNMNEVLVPILQLREYQEKMELFSTNDLDPREFERYGEHIFAESEPSSENFALMRKRGVEQLQEYRSILEQFSGSPFFDEFLSAEKRWYQAVELLYMTLAILPGVVWVDDHNSLIEEYRNSAHADAMYELRKLVYGENNYSELGQERGDSIEVERWGQVRIGFSRHESIQYLNVVGANKLFADATSADDESIQLASLIASEEILTTLRTLREELMIMVRGYQLNTMFINE